ncbi:MAG: hypothetical protein C3F06_13645 [Candidatus Methanoperedenaceae archaeon]|nr:MAG: hypothetical protein C3F06_13645 [Candidatus Methanoperedenaceae archaeon]
MQYKRLFILIEGDDDEKIFQRIIKPIFEKKYDHVMLWKYAQEKDDKIFKFIKSIESMDADYICVADINGSPCVTDRKQRLHKDIKNIEKEKIVVVKKEIESWYLSGLNETSSKKLKVKSFVNTEHITKKQFNDLIPKIFDSRIDFMSEILKFFCMNTAKMKNESFKYFIEKFECGI